MIATYQNSRQHTLTTTMNMEILTLPMMNTRATVAVRALMVTKKNLEWCAAWDDVVKRFYFMFPFTALCLWTLLIIIFLGKLVHLIWRQGYICNKGSNTGTRGTKFSVFAFFRPIWQQCEETFFFFVISGCSKICTFTLMDATIV